VRASERGGGGDGARGVVAACLAAATPEVTPAADWRAGCRVVAAAGVLPLGGGASEEAAARAAATARWASRWPLAAVGRRL